MASIKLKFRPSLQKGREGALYYQIILNRSVRRVKTGHRIYAEEWDEKLGMVIVPKTEHLRYERLNSIRNDVEWGMRRFENLLKTLDAKNLSPDIMVSVFRGKTEEGKGVFEYIQNRITKLKGLGRDRCSETMECTLRSFMRFRGGVDLDFPNFTKDILEQYEAYLKAKGLTRNTTSFYMRNLRTAYKLAVEDGLTVDNQPFSKVYTGVDKTVKRAITIEEVRKIKSLDLKRHPALDFSKDMLLFSFYMRGMSFVDMAYLRKKDLVHGYIIYRRKKTGQQLTIELVTEAQQIISKYRNDTQYLLPIITSENGEERMQYKVQLMRVNRNLKKIGEMVGLSIPLSTYVMRHSWATIARDKGIELSIISEGLGHDNEATTRIYLDSIRATKVDKANRAILDDL